MFSSNASQVSDSATYIEDVFSTYLYTGTGSALTITNGIDLAGEGGLVWIKSRGTAGSNHSLRDTVRGNDKVIFSNLSNAQATQPSGYGLTAFNSNGFSLGTNYSQDNISGDSIASWTFRKQPKFFDVVTYTGDGVSGRLVSHNLGSTPGCVFIKRTNATENWAVAHRGNGTGSAWTRFSLNSTSAGDQGVPQSYATSTTVSVTDVTGAASSPNGCNVNGATYVMYLFAHNAGGFGESGEDNVISCGSVTDNNRVELGYEPQFLLMKKVNDTTNWILVDSMRGLTADTNLGNSTLFPNTSGAEASGARYANIDATGFTSNMGSPGTHIYIAIRRGPMKVPESGTSVFNATLSAAATNTKITTGFVPDTQIMMFPPSAGNTPKFYDRLRGVNTTGVDVITQFLQGASTAAEASNIGYTRYWQNDGYQISSAFGSNQWVYWTFGRAPGFMDVCCYTGTGVARTVAHNLAAVPELMIVKGRSALSVASNWCVYCSHVIGAANTGYLYLNNTDNYTDNTTFWDTAPTSSVFSLSSNNTVNENTDTFVAYLFASCPGVSKVGSYTGTATTLQIDCGFTAGARFVLIKRTDSTGAWYVWDSARGIVAGNDPYLLLNSTAAEVTSTDYIDTYSAGFEISSTAPAAINASGGTFIFLAIA